MRADRVRVSRRISDGMCAPRRSPRSSRTRRPMRRNSGAKQSLAALGTLLEAVAFADSSADSNALQTGLRPKRSKQSFEQLQDQRTTSQEIQTRPMRSSRSELPIASALQLRHRNCRSVAERICPSLLCTNPRSSCVSPQAGTGKCIDRWVQATSRLPCWASEVHWRRPSLQIHYSRACTNRPAFNLHASQTHEVLQLLLRSFEAGGVHAATDTPRHKC